MQNARCSNIQDTECRILKKLYAGYMLRDAGFPDVGDRSLMKDAGQVDNIKMQGS
jgi:hypothetical protein